MPRTYSNSLGLFRIILVIALVGFTGWWWQQMNHPEDGRGSMTTAEECAAITHHVKRRDCYLHTESRRMLEAAIDSEDPGLCSELDHVFIPHDVQSDIENGIIGEVVEGEKALTTCRRAVQSGRLPGV